MVPPMTTCRFRRRQSAAAGLLLAASAVAGAMEVVDERTVVDPVSARRRVDTVAPVPRRPALALHRARLLGASDGYTACSLTNDVASPSTRSPASPGRPSTSRHEASYRAAVRVIDLATRSLVGSFDVACSSSNVIAVQAQAGQADCAVPTERVGGLEAVAAADDVVLGWAALADAGGYNGWRVKDKRDIPIALAPPATGVRGVCLAGALPACTDPAVVGDGGTYFYQVRGLCAGAEGP
jgi:hypothetical protein